MDSNSLIPSGFSTQGTIDWVSLADKAVSVSLGILSRCSAAGVDPYTLAVGGIVAKKLVLSPQGHRNIQDALTQLKSYSGFGNMLWFGFGVRSLVRTLGMRDEWRSLLAYCACLSECFSEEYAAEVMHDLVVAHHPPEDMTPSVGEWLMVIKTCAGCVSTTKFPVLAEGFMRLALPAAKGASGKYAGYPHKVQPPARDLNNVVVALSRVASGEILRVTVSGDTVATGWIAAVAKWLFDLSITFEDSTGQVQYCDCSAAEQSQLLISSNHRQNDCMGLSLESETYSLNGAEDLVRPAEVPITGRLEWDSCLESTFGQDFRDLMAFPVEVGAVLGSAARIYEGIVRAEPDISIPALSCHSAYFAGSHGTGFIQTTLRWFPEMNICEDSMRNGTRLSLENAIAHYREQRDHLEEKCQCWTQQVEGRRTKRRLYCFVELLDTIMRLSQLLSGLHISPGLLPTRSGIEGAHLDQDYVNDLCLPTVGPLWQIYKGNKDAYTHLEDIKTATGRRLACAMALFTGQRSSAFDAGASALSSKGICAYFDVLCNINLDRDLVGSIHVVPGQLGRNSRNFKAVINQGSLHTYPTSAKEAVALMPLIEDASMTVTEAVDSLRVAYTLSVGSLELSNSQLQIKCSPRDIIHSICAGRGRVRFPCPRPQCEDEIASIRGDIEKSGQKDTLPMIKVKDKKLYEYDGPEVGVLGKVAALLLNANFVSSWPEPITPYCIFSDSDCMDCCIYQLSMQDTDNWPLLI